MMSGGATTQYEDTSNPTTIARRFYIVAYLRIMDLYQRSAESCPSFWEQLLQSAAAVHYTTHKPDEDIRMGVA